MATDAYQNYINTGEMRQPEPTLGSTPSTYQDTMPGAGAAAAAPADLPYYSADVDAAIAKAKAAGTPITSETLSALPHAFWTRNAPLFSEHGMGKTKIAHDEARAAFLQGAQDYNNKYLLAHQAKEAAANPGASQAHGFWDNAVEGAKDFGRVALDGTASGLLEAGRLVGGGAATLYGMGERAVTGSNDHPEDAYFKAYDAGPSGVPGSTTATQHALMQDQASAATRSPIMGGVLGGIPGAIATGGVAPTMNMVQGERDAGGSVGQQEAMLGLGTAVNTASMALPFVGNAAGKALTSAATKGLVGDAAKAAITREVGSNLAGNVLRSSAVNAGVGAAQVIGANAIDAKNNPLAWKEIGIQAAIGAVLGAAHGHMSKAEAMKVAGRLETGPVQADGSVALTDPLTKQTFTAPKGTPAAEAAAAPTVEGVQPDGSTVVSNATADLNGNRVNVIPAGEAVPGAGLPPTAHTSLLADIGKSAANIARKTKKDFDTLNDGQKLPTLMTRSAALAQHTAGDRWAQMSPVQQAQATGQAATALNRVLHVDGVSEAAAGLETTAATAVKPAAQISETGQPDLGAGDKPQVLTGAAGEAAPVAGMGDGTPPPGATPQDAQAIAEQAMSDNQSPSGLADLVPPDAAGRTRAQASSPDEIAAHNRVDEALKRGGSGLTDNNLALMPYKNKVARLEKTQAGRVDNAMGSKRSDKDFPPQVKEMHDVADQQIMAASRNVLGKGISKRALDKMTLQEKAQKMADLRGQHLEGTMTPDDLKQMVTDSQHGETVAADGTRSFDPTSARNAADAYAARIGLEPVNGKSPGPQEGATHAPLPLDDTGNVTLTGGVKLSKTPTDGTAVAAVALDKRFPPTQKIGSHVVNMRWAVAQHEIFESWLMHHYGMGYEAAHHGATLHENAAVEARYPGLKAEDYQAAAKPYIEHIEEATQGKAQDPTLDGAPQKGLDLGDEDTAARSQTPTANEVNGGRDVLQSKRPKKAPAPERANAPEPNATRSGKTESNRETNEPDVVGKTLEGKVSTDDIEDVRALVKNAQEGELQPLLDRVREMQDDGHISQTEAAVLRKQGRVRPLDVERELSTPAEALPKVSDDLAKAAIAKLKNPLKRETGAQMVARLREEFAGRPVHQRAIDLFEWTLKQNPKLAELLHGVRGEKTAPGVGGSYTYADRLIKIATNQNIPVDAMAHELAHAAEELLPTPVRQRVFAARKADIARLQVGASEAEKPFFAILRKQISTANEIKALQYSEDAHAALSQIKGKTDARQMELYSLTDAGEYWAVNAAKLIADKAAPKTFVEAAKAWVKDFAHQISNVLKGNPRRDAIAEGLHHVLSGKAVSQDRLPTSIAMHEADFKAVQARFTGQPEALSPMANLKPESQVITRSPADTIKDDNPISQWDNLRAYLSEDMVGLEKLDQDNIRLGLSLTPIRGEAVSMMGNRSWLRNSDEAQVLQPAKQWIADNYHRFSLNAVEAMSKVGEFMQAHHQVTERMPLDWAKKVPLENGMEAVRDSIIQDTISSKSTAEAQKSLARLMPLAQKHASIPFDAWENGPDSLRPKMVARLQELAKEGINEKTLAPFNKLVQDMENRTHQRRIEGGFVSEDDRMARANNYKWSTPQKGGEWHGLETEAATMQANDLTNLRHEAKGKYFAPQVIHASQLKTAEGRSTWANNTVVRAVTDMQNAATEAANKKFLSALQDNIESGKEQIAKRLQTETDPKIRAQLENHEYNHTEIQTLTGTPYEGYDDVATGKHYDRLPTPERSVIHHDGREHYVIQFPENSKTLYSLQAMGTDVDWRDMPFLKAVIESTEAVINTPTHIVNALAGTKFKDQTHLISRSTRSFTQMLTVFKPIWSLTRILPRSLYEKTYMLGVMEGKGVGNGLKLGFSALGHTLTGSFSKTSGRSYAMLVNHDFEGLRALGKADPQSWAGMWLRMNQEGGGNVFTQGLSMADDNNVFVNAIKSAKRNPLLKGAHYYADRSRGFADMLENVTSVGTFRSLVESGMGDHEAAIKTKQLMNFQKKGMAGNMLGGMHGFYRVIASVNDTVYQAFLSKEGMHEQTFMGHKFNSRIDYHKLAMTALVMGSYGALDYMASRALMGKDEDGTDNMKKVIAQNPATIVQNSFFPNPNDPSHPYQVPMGLGMPQLINGPGKILAALAYGDITPAQAAHIATETFQRNISIIDPAGTAENADTSTKLFAYALQAIMPTVGQQGYALFSNVDNLGHPIHTSDPKQNKFAADQGKAGTPEMWKDAAQHMQKVTGVDYFPETLQFLANTFAGPLTDLMRVTAGDAAREKQGLPAKGLEGITGTKAFGADYYDSQRLFATIDDLDETQRQLNAVQARSGFESTSPEAKDAGQQWLSGNPKAQARIDALKALEGAKKTYATQIKAIQASNYSAEGRRLQRKQADSALRRATDEARKALD